MTEVEELKSNIGFINEFMTNYINKTTNLSDSTLETLKSFDNIIAIEKNNETFLKKVEDSISDDEILHTTETLNKYIRLINEKQQEYLSLIKKNSNKITEISNSIRVKKESIDKIFNMCDVLDKNISLISNKGKEDNSTTQPIDMSSIQ